MELNKIAAAILLAGLLGMITGKVADILYHSDDGTGHGEHEVARGYSIDVPEDMSAVGAAGAAEQKLASIIPFMAGADVAAGETYFKKKCALCHSIDNGGANKTGPNLWGIMGKDKGSKAGYNYSSAMASFEGNWGFEEMSAFIYKPKKYIPGTIMAFAGEKKEQKRADLIAYLRSQGSSSMAIPAAPAPEPEATEPAAE